MLPRRRSEGPIIDRQSIVRMVIGLRALGVDPDPALRQIGWSCDEILASTVPFRCSFLYDFWQSLTEREGPGLGLRLAAQARPKMLPLVGDILANSASLGDALLRGSRFMRLVHGSTELSLAIEGDRGVLFFAPLHREFMHPEGAELLAGIIDTFTKRLARRHVRAEEVRFWHPAPPDTTRHTAFFQAPVRFGQPHDAVVFRTALLH
jgi:hypothetical protein